MVDVSIILPALNEEGNIEHVIKQVLSVLGQSSLNFEIIVVDGGSIDGTLDIAKENQVICLKQSKCGYADALLIGFKAAKGEWICTLDSDNSHPPDIINSMLLKRDEFDLIVASRFVKGGSSEANFVRLILSHLLNKIFRIVLAVPLTDFSSGFRLYKKNVILESYEAENFDILPEILIKAFIQGHRITEVPFRYKDRTYGSSHARVIRFGFDFLRTLFKLQKLVAENKLLRK